MKDYFKVSDIILMDENIDASQISQMAVNHMRFTNYMNYVEQREQELNK